MRVASLALIVSALIGMWTLRASAQAPAPAGEAPPTVEQLKDLLKQQKYSEVLRGVAKCMALKGPAAQNYDRYDLLMLRGETYLHTHANAAAADAFAAAQNQTTDAARKDTARANEVLIRRSKPQGYLSKGSATTKPTLLPIADEADRKAAFAALLSDELSAAAPKVKTATAGNTLPPIIDVARMLSDLRAIETAGGGSGEQVKGVATKLGDHAHLLIADALKKTDTRVEECWHSGSRRRYQLNADGTRGDQLYGMIGLTSVESGDLNNAMATCEKVAPVASGLAAVAGDSAELASNLTADAKEAQRLAARAKEVLNYDYNNSGRYTPTDGQGQTPVTPVTPVTPRRGGTR